MGSELGPLLYYEDEDPALASRDCDASGSTLQTLLAMRWVAFSSNTFTGQARF